MAKRGDESKADVDGYLERLVKYIPGEVLAFFTPIAGLLGTANDLLLQIVFVVALVGAPFWLYVSTLQPGGRRKVKRYMYVLAPIAFAIWAVNVNAEIASFLSISSVAAAVILAMAVFVIPAIDIIADYRTPPTS